LPSAVRPPAFVGTGSGVIATFWLALGADALGAVLGVAALQATASMLMTVARTRRRLDPAYR
jgi:hypothetical protein